MVSAYLPAGTCLKIVLIILILTLIIYTGTRLQKNPVVHRSHLTDAPGGGYVGTDVYMIYTCYCTSLSLTRTALSY